VVRRRPGSQTRDERQSERDASALRFIGVMCLVLGGYLAYAFAVATIKGTLPSPWLLVPMLGSAICFLGIGLTVFGTLTERWTGPMLRVGAPMVVGGLAVGLLVEEAWILGAILALLTIWFAVVMARGRWRRRNCPR
jgi:hypothetical protein